MVWRIRPLAVIFDRHHNRRSNNSKSKPLLGCADTDAEQETRFLEATEGASMLDLRDSKEIYSSRAWGSKAPWPFVLLFLLTFLFFGGGLLLDTFAGRVSTESIRSLFPTEEKTIDGKTGEQKTVVRDMAVHAEDRNALIAFEKERADRLSASAKLLYDMAKIALGALLTCLTQMINAVVQRQTPDDQAPPVVSAADGP
jgi:hypothetical protein